MEEGLTIALIFLVCTSTIVLIILAVFACLLFNDLRELVKSYTKLSETVQKELYPTLEEIKKALDGINSLISGVDKQITAVKSSVGSAYDVMFNLASKFKGGTIALIGGFLAGLRLFLKRKK